MRPWLPAWVPLVAAERNIGNNRASIATAITVSTKVKPLSLRAVRLPCRLIARFGLQTRLTVWLSARRPWLLTDRRANWEGHESVDLAGVAASILGLDPGVNLRGPIATAVPDVVAGHLISQSRRHRGRSARSRSLLSETPPASGSQWVVAAAPEGLSYVGNYET